MEQGELAFSAEDLSPGPDIELDLPEDSDDQVSEEHLSEEQSPYEQTQDEAQEDIQDNIDRHDEPEDSLDIKPPQVHAGRRDKHKHKRKSEHKHSSRDRHSDRPRERSSKHKDRSKDKDGERRERGGKDRDNRDKKESSRREKERKTSERKENREREAKEKHDADVREKRDVDTKRDTKDRREAGVRDKRETDTRDKRDVDVRDKCDVDLRDVESREKREAKEKRDSEKREAERKENERKKRERKEAEARERKAAEAEQEKKRARYQREVEEDEERQREKSLRERERLERIEMDRRKVERDRLRKEQDLREKLLRDRRERELERERAERASQRSGDDTYHRPSSRNERKRHKDQHRHRDDPRDRSPHRREWHHEDQHHDDEHHSDQHRDDEHREDSDMAVHEIFSDDYEGHTHTEEYEQSHYKEEQEETSSSSDETDSHDSDTDSESEDDDEDSVSSSGDEQQDSQHSGHIRSRFDDASDQEMSEPDTAPEDASPDDMHEDMNDDGENYIEETPPESPIELAPELPAYYPALQGCRSVEEFHCLNRIEEGTYGVVYRARDKKIDEIVALKRLKMEKEKEGFPITSLREINTLLKAQHPNIVTVREIVVGSNMDKIYIVMDYVEHDLKGLMESMKEPFIIGEVKTLMLQLQRGVAHLHDNWIIHRDLKTSNLLLSHKGILKIGDFGLAREYGSPLKQYTPIVVTLWYRAPELLLGTKEYSTAIDMWSVGCIFSELLTRKALFPGKSEIDELNRIFKELGTPTEKIWPGVSELPAMKKCTFTEYPYNQLRNRFGTMLSGTGFDLLNRFLTYNPSRRITAEEALKHEFFTEGPLPVDPSMFPTWPAKSEQSRRSHGNSPKPPSGGKAYSKLLGDEDDPGSFMFAMAKNAASGPGFSLKF